MSVLGQKKSLDLTEKPVENFTFFLPRLQLSSLRHIFLSSLDASLRLRLTMDEFEDLFAKDIWKTRERKTFRKQTDAVSCESKFHM